MTSQVEQSRDWLIQAYFNSPDRMIRLDEGDVLMRAGQPNERLYHVRTGTLRGYDDELGPDGKHVDKLKSGPGDFVGLHSFFSHSHLSRFTVQAETECELAFIDTNQSVISDGGFHSLAEQFLQVIIAGMVYREELMHQVARQQEKVLAQVHEYERLASLGQLSAGVAHELNNALAVIFRGTHWLGDHLAVLVNKLGQAEDRYYALGREHGRALSTQQTRRRRQELTQTLKLSENLAEQMAQMNLDDEQARSDRKLLQKQGDWLVQLWEAGATLKDLEAAARHAEHVIKSMKTLGAKQELLQDKLDINETIQEAVSLLHSKLRLVQMELRLEATRCIRGSHGALVQIWVNIIKNAIEACQEGQTGQARVDIQSSDRDGAVAVELIDNGPGIDKEVLPQIFQPNITTKKKGLAFGLGLGLTIVQRLVKQHYGEITVESEKGRTTFTVTFPAALSGQSVAKTDSGNQRKEIQ